MVMRNTISRRDGDDDEPVNLRTRPRKFLFDVGEYEVAVQRQRSNQKKHYQCIRTQIWHGKTKVGCVELTTTYQDVKTVMAVHTLISRQYQGLGIAYRVYEGLVNEANIAITSHNQSRGAIKLWRRFAVNRGLRLYLVNDAHSGRLFSAAIYDVVLDEGKQELEAIDYHAKRVSPYKHPGSLMLVRRRSALDNAIQKHIAHHRKIFEIADRFKRFDQFKPLT
jgi:hypothetical protein